MNHPTCAAGLARAETIDALPALLTLARRLVVTTCDVTDPETNELKRLLDACVIGAYRLRLQEHLRTKGDGEQG